MTGHLLHTYIYLFSHMVQWLLWSRILTDMDNQGKSLFREKVWQLFKKKKKTNQITFDVLSRSLWKRQSGEG